MSDPAAPPAGAPADPAASGAATKKKLSPLVIVLILVVGLVVVGGGVFVGLVVFGARKYLSEAKVAEARLTLRLLATKALEAHARRGKFCPAASAPVPASVPKGVKYQSAASEWSADGVDVGFGCLGYVASMPQYFQYAYEVEGDGTSPGDSFVVRAHGDLDGDGVTSAFSLRGKVIAGGGVALDQRLTELRAEE